MTIPVILQIQRWSKTESLGTAVSDEAAAVPVPQGARVWNCAGMVSGKIYPSARRRIWRPEYNMDHTGTEPVLATSQELMAWAMALPVLDLPQQTILLWDT
jgi:hypothetical protein